MKIFDLNQKCDLPIALSLGFFDCIHTGHKRLVERSIECARTGENGAKYSALLTFRNDPNARFGKSPQIYTFEDRKCVLDALQLDVLIGAMFDDDFVSLSPYDFLNILTEHFCVKVIVVGADYTFGYRAQGNVSYLNSFCEEHGIKLVVEPFEEVDGKKLSTRNLKDLVLDGDVCTLNKLLSYPYFMSGQVAHERHDGTKIGYPTANLLPNGERLALKDGIYATKIVVDGKIYNAMTNVGAKPTFNQNSPSIETHIFDFSGDIYGKDVKILFFERTRDIIKFPSVEELKLQLQRDEMQIRSILSKIKF